MKRVVVFDTGNRAFLNSRVLDANYAARFPGASFLPLIRDKLAQAGWSMMTGDDFLAQRPRAADTICLCDAYTPFTDRLIAAGVMPRVIFSGESPNVLPWFYHRLETYLRPFRHAVIFRGFASWAPSGTTPHTFWWPSSCSTVIEGPSWKDRDLLVMVASNKSRAYINPRRVLQSLARIARDTLRWKYYQAVDPRLRFADLYPVRMRAIRHFALNPSFHLYGKGWDTLFPGYRFANRPAECDDKISTMARFRFSLCFENCVFPGYVTEKIFDGMFAGTVPVYCGAPDVDDFCPTDCYIRFQCSTNLMDLQALLEDYPETEWKRKRGAINDYLRSEAFRRFRQESLASHISDLLLS